MFTTDHVPLHQIVLGEGAYSSKWLCTQAPMLLVVEPKIIYYAVGFFGLLVFLEVKLNLSMKPLRNKASSNKAMKRLEFIYLAEYEKVYVDLNL